MPADKVAVGRQHAAEVLRPRPVHTAIDDNVTDLARAELLRNRREAKHGIDFSVGEQPHCVCHRWRDECDVIMRIDADVRRDAGDVQVVAASKPRHGNGPPLQIFDRADAIGAEQLEAAGVDSG
jgi:hypothetical protein